MTIQKSKRTLALTGALAAAAIPLGCGGTSVAQTRACWNHAASAAVDHMDHSFANYNAAVRAAHRQLDITTVRYELASARTYKHGRPAGDAAWVRAAQRRCGNLPH